MDNWLQCNVVVGNGGRMGIRRYEVPVRTSPLRVPTVFGAHLFALRESCGEGPGRSSQEALRWKLQLLRGSYFVTERQFAALDECDLRNGPSLVQIASR